MCATLRGIHRVLSESLLIFVFSGRTCHFVLFCHVAVQLCIVIFKDTDTSLPPPPPFYKREQLQWLLKDQGPLKRGLLLNKSSCPFSLPLQIVLCIKPKLCFVTCPMETLVIKMMTVGRWVDRRVCQASTFCFGGIILQPVDIF